MIKWRRTAELDAKSVVKSWQTYTVLVLVMFAMMFFGVCHPTEQGLFLPSGTAAKVDGEKISATEFRRAYINYSNQLQQQYRDKFDPVALGVSSQVLNGLVDRLALYEEALKSGLYASQEEIEHMIIDGEYFKGEKGGFDAERFKTYLRSQGHTEASFTEELRREIVTNKFRALITGSYQPSEKLAELNYQVDETKIDVEYLRIDPKSFPITVAAADIDKFLKEGGEAKVKEYYDANKSEFNQEQKVKARHILIAYQGARNASGDAAKRSKADAKALADKVQAEAKSSPDFAALATKYTDEASGKAKGGDLGYFKRDQMVKEFADAAFAMKPGDVSKVVESPFGFHVIKVDSIQDAKSVSLEDAKREIAEKLVARDRRPQIMDEKVKELLTAIKEGKGEDQLKALGLSWKATGPFSIGARFVPGLGADKNVLVAVSSLHKIGDITPNALDMNGAKVIARLKSRQEADLSKLTPEKRKELADSSRYMDSYMLFSALTGDIRKRYEDKGKIYRNPEFLNYDQLNRQASNSAE